ncbi:MAG: hypothetical protein GY940_12950 [bacterium]|nr:hypothetical protein [bacterium]
MNHWRMGDKKTVIPVVILILLFAMALRLNAPRADLPSHITFSGSILTDEGNQCHNSRSKALYGEWYPDDWRITNYNPFLPYIKLALFKLFGVGILQMRMVSHIFAFLTLLFFFLTLRSCSRKNPGFALLGTLLLGVNFLYLMYNKIGTFETSITFWVVLTIYFLEKYRVKRKRLFLILSGASAFMGFIFKSIMAYLLPLPFVACILMHFFSSREQDSEGDSSSPVSNGFSLKKAMLDMLFILGGVLILSVPWYIFHYLPNKEWIISTPGQFMGKLMFPRNLENAFQNFLTFPWKDQFYKIPMVWVSALIYIPVFIRRLLARRARLTETAAILFFLAHTFVFFVMNYRPTRYFVPVIPVLVLLTVLLMKRLYSASIRKDEAPGFRKVEKIIIAVLDTLWLTLAAYFCFLPLLGRLLPGIPQPPLSVFYVVVSALIVFGGYYLKKFSGKWKSRVPVKPVIGIMVAIALLSSLGYYWQWNKTRTFAVRDMSIELGRELDNAYIGGMTATVAVLENRHKALWLYPNFVNWNADTFKKYPMTHVLLGTDVSKEVFHFFKQWPERMGRAALLKVYPVKDYSVHLYSFIDPYIRDCQRDEAGNYRLTVMNPGKGVIKAKVGRVYQTDEALGVKVEKNGHQFDLAEGENVVRIEVGEMSQVPDGVDSVLFFLDYERALGGVGEPLRYEAESFQRRTGVNRGEESVSGGVVRYFERDSQTPGFLGYGPAVPYAKGVLVVDFKLKFGDLKTKLREVCRLDIYSHEDQGVIAERVVKPGDIKKIRTDENGYGVYRLTVVLTGTRTLEFRVQSTKWADVWFDCVDVIYYQGLTMNY